MNQLFNRTRKAVMALLLVGLSAIAFAQGPPNFPPTSVYARAYAAWSVIGQQANTYTFNGRVCYFSPFNNGATSPFFVFSGTNGGSTVYFPVAIIDANPSLNEIVTPTSTTNTAAACGFSASTANSHTSFTLSSGTAGLQEALTSQLQNAPPTQVLLDKYWYQLVAGLPGAPSAYSIINSASGSANVQIVDTTTAPWTYFCYNGTNYTTCASNQTVPTVAAGSGAGTSPTITVVGTGLSGIVTLTTGTTPTASATIFTLTWPAIASGGFQYAPACTISTIGTRAYTGTNASVAGPPAVDTYTATGTALTASVSGYKWSYTCR